MYSRSKAVQVGTSLSNVPATKPLMIEAEPSSTNTGKNNYVRGTSSRGSVGWLFCLGQACQVRVCGQDVSWLPSQDCSHQTNLLQHLHNVESIKEKSQERECAKR